jgi:hypothetical protein
MEALMDRVLERAATAKPGYGPTIVVADDRYEVIREPAFGNHGVWDLFLMSWKPGYNVWDNTHTLEECKLAITS